MIPKKNIPKRIPYNRQPLRFSFPGKFKPFKFSPYIPRRLDSDRDGTPNWKDCRPLNPRLQHVSRTMEERLRRLPIVASPTCISEEKRMMFERVIPEVEKIDKDDYQGLEQVAHLMHSRQLPHIMSKEAKQTAPVAVRLFLATIEKYPGIVSEIERAKPKKVIVASEYQPKGKSQRGWTSPCQEVYVGPHTPYFSKANIKKLAKTIYHELTHVKQLKKIPMKEVLRQIGMAFEERPMEIEAMEYSEQKIKEYKKGKKPTGEEISKTLDLD